MNRAQICCLPVLVLGLLTSLHWSALPAAAEQPVRSPRKAKVAAAGSWKRLAHASWYGKHFQGKRTAGGSRFDSLRLTAAHRTLQFGSKVRVTELRSGRSVVVEITDRGPFLQGRDIDLSYAAPRELGIVERGVAPVELELVTEAGAPSPPIGTAMNNLAPWWLAKAVVE